MTETPWTPGPWRWLTEDSREWNGKDGDENNVGMYGVTLCGPRGETVADEAFPKAADARLIAAAPELAEALQELTLTAQALRDQVASGGPAIMIIPRLDDQLKHARAALARAKGDTD